MSFFKSLSSNVMSVALKFTGILPGEDDGESDLESMRALPDQHQPSEIITAGTSPPSMSSHSTLRQPGGVDSPDSATGVSKAQKIGDRLLEQNDNEEDSSAWSRDTADLLHVSSSDSDGPNKRNVGLRSYDKRAESRDQRVPKKIPTQPDNSLFKIDGDALPGKLPLKKMTSLSLLPSIPSASKSQSPSGSLMDGSLADAERFTIYVTRDGGVRKIKVTDGAGEFPAESSTVKYLYKIATNVNFQLPLVYKMQKECPTISVLTSADIIVGVKLAVMSMQAGERAIFRIEPTYGYGMSNSYKLKISSREVIYLYVELLEVLAMDLANTFLSTDPMQRFKKFTNEEIGQAADQLHALGKEVFANGSYAEAAKYFLEALTARKLEDTPNHCQSQRNTLFARLENNAALSYLNEGKLSEAEEHAKKALELRADIASMAKACYILAKVSDARTDLTEAVSYAKRGLSISPKHPELTQLLDLCEKKAADAKEQSHNFFKKCATGLGSVPTTNNSNHIPLATYCPNIPIAGTSSTVTTASGKTFFDGGSQVTFSARSLGQAITTTPKDEEPKVMSRIDFLRQNRQTREYGKITGSGTTIGGKKRSFKASMT